MLKKELTVGIILIFILSSLVPITSSYSSYEINKVYTIHVDDNGTLSGYVNDTSMNPIEGARVRVYFHETYEENCTDSSGYYHVTNIPICKCTKNATVSKKGYRSECVLLSINETTTHNFVLTPLGNTLYVGGSGPGNYSRIQDAVDNASNWDTVFVYTGTYNENVVIDKEIKLLGEKKEDTVVDGGQKHTVIIILADNVILNNFTIRGSGNGFDSTNMYNMDAGIRITSNNVNVSNNIFRDNFIGILVYNASNNSFFNNDFMSTGGCIYNFNSTYTQIMHNSFKSTNGGIIVGQTSHDIIKNNILDDVYLLGLRIWNCSHAEIIGNNVTGNSGFGILVTDSFQNRICYNSVSIGQSNSYRSFMLDNSSNNIIRGNHVYNSRWDGMVFFSSSNNNTIIVNKLSNNRNSGLVIAYSSGNHVEQNEIVNTDGHSISVYGGSTHNRIINNVISGYEEFTHSGYSGINIEEKSSDNIIISNIITNHSLHGIDVYSHNNTISSNVIDSNGHDGIHFRHANDNLISKNVITKNDNGVYLEEISCNNHISKNSITENVHHGIYFESLSKGNSIFSNNFIGNNVNAYFESKRNTWRRNYWEKPRILPYKISGDDDLFEFDWFPRLFPVNIENGLSLFEGSITNCEHKIFSP